MGRGEPSLVILAAGASRRLGTCKALVALRESQPSTPLAMLLEAAAELTQDSPLVVTGPDHEAILAAAPAGVELVRNRDWSAGRTGSVIVAVSARPNRDLCLAPVDVPLVPRALFRALVRAWTEAGAPPRGWLAPRVGSAGTPSEEADGAFGHPIVIGRELLGELLGWSPQRPLRALRELADPLFAVDVEDLSVLDDLDRPEDLQELRERLSEDGRSGSS